MSARRRVLYTAATLVVLGLLASGQGYSAPRVSRSDCVKSSLLSNLKDTAALYTGKLTTKLDATSFGIFEKVRLDPAPALSEAEQKWIEKQGLTKALSDYRASANWVREANHWLALDRRLQPLNWKSASWKQRAWKWLREYFMFGFGPNSSATKIFGKFIDNPSYELSPGEQVFIRKWRLDGELARFKQDLEMNRKGFMVMSRINQTGRAVRWTVLGGVAATSVVMGQTLQHDLSPQEAFDPRKPDGLKPQGEVDLLLPTNATNPPVLVVGGGAFVFSPLKVGVELTQNSATLAEMKKDGVQHFRIRLKATPQQIEDLTEKVGKYVDSTQGQPVYFDTPNAEIFRILRQEFNLPPLPVVNRMNKPFVNYFKLLHVVGGSQGPVPDIYRVGHVATGAEKAEEIGGDALGGLWGADMLFSSPIVVGSLATYDQVHSTIHTIGKPSGH